MNLQRIVLWLGVLGFAGFGIAFALFPTPMAALVDIQLPTDTARVDFVATYGGFEIGFAAFLWLCTRDPNRLALGLLAAGMALAGFASTRLLGLLLSNDVRPVLYLVAALELSGAVLELWAARRAAHKP